MVTIILHEIWKIKQKKLPNQCKHFCGFLSYLFTFFPSFFLSFLCFLLLFLICKYICMFVTWFVHTCTYMIHAFLCLVLENALSPACNVKSSSFHLVSLKSLQGQGSYLCLSIILLRAQHLAHCHVLSIIFTEITKEQRTL